MSTSTTIFGRIIAGNDVEAWLMDTLRTWSSTYIAEVERQHGIPAGALARIRSWQVAPTFDAYPEDQLPRLILVSVGLAEKPLKDGQGVHRARWQVGLGIVSSARTQAEAHAQAMLYIAAHRKVLLDRPSLGGRALGVEWQNEDYTQLTYDDARSLGWGEGQFAVEVADVATARAGPVTPDDPLDTETDPWPLWPQVETVTTSVTAAAADAREEA